MPPDLLQAFTNPNFPHDYALIATTGSEQDERIIGEARYAPAGIAGHAEFAIVIADECRGRGLASRLLRGLTTAAAVAGLKRLDGLVLRENQPMRSLAADLGFISQPEPDDHTVVRVIKHLGIAADAA